MSGTRMRLGIFGGSFDPIHYGHLLVAEEARATLSLEEVVFIPTGQPWMKPERVLSPSEHRMNMVRLAIASNPFLCASPMEIDRPGLTYTIDTLEELRREVQDEPVYCLILGADSLRELPRWKEPAKLLEQCTLVTAPRPGYPNPDLTSLDAIKPAASDQVAILKGPAVGISGTEIRSRITDGLSVRYQVPEEVEDYIHRYGLYRGSGVNE